MRILELSQRSGIPIPTIKYYLREGLLPPGKATAPNQAHYDESHVERLQLIRALREGGGLGIATLGRVFAAMERCQTDVRPDYLSIAIRELTDPVEIPADEAADYDRAHQEVDRLLARLGWDTDEDSPGHDELVRAVARVQRYLPDFPADVDTLVPYATAMRAVAGAEIPDTFDLEVDRSATLRFSVLGTVLYEPVLLALRKLAHVDRVRQVAPAAAPRRKRKRR